MISNYNINLHFNQAVAQRTGYAFKIGDKGCKFNIHCEDLDPTGMNPHIIFNHSDGTCVEGIPTTISARDYEYVIKGNEFGVCGKTVVDVKFYDGDPATQRISTASFMIEILPDTITPFDENAGPYADSLERAKEELDEATSDLADMDALFAQTLQDYIDAFGNTAPINPRGAYDPNELYKPRDAVYYTSGGKTLTYLNNLECTGVDPTNTSNWQPIIDITGIPAIIDNCTSTSTTDALSANQGRVLAENLSHKNFLINAFFTINQRGATIVTSGYGADGWLFGGGISGSNIEFAIGRATLTNVQMQQFLEDQILNGYYTLSVEKLDGTIYHGTINKTDDVSSFEAVNNEDVYVAYNAQYKSFVISTYGKNTNTFVAAKLEPGTFSTLHLDNAPNPTIELLKCQTRCKVWEFSINQVVGIAFGDGTGGYIELPISVPFRTTPYGVTYSGSLGILGDPIVSLQYASGGINGSNVIIYIQKSTSLSPNTPYIVQAISAFKIIVSADIV